MADEQNQPFEWSLRYKVQPFETILLNHYVTIGFTDG